MSWFQRLTGFREVSYKETQSLLEVQGDRLASRVNGKSYGIGSFELVSLAELRKRALSGPDLPGRLRMSVIQGDVRSLHGQPEFAGALFQVASQFNMLEMTSPNVCPEDGVTRYMFDPTQGPACAIAAGAATLYRNFFVPVNDQIGQTSKLQLDGLSDLGTVLSGLLETPVSNLWQMRNGYANCSAIGLRKLSGLLKGLGEAELDELRGLLQIGVHRGVEVTDSECSPGPVVSQAFCSALPVAYSEHKQAPWEPFASLILEAAYEATMWEAVCNAQAGASNVVVLTRLGGGAFGNQGARIDAAMQRALGLVSNYGLDVRLVTYKSPLKYPDLVNSILRFGAFA